MQLKQSLRQINDPEIHCRLISSFSKNPNHENVDNVIKSIIFLSNNKTIIEASFEGFIKCFICLQIGNKEKISIDCQHVVHSQCLEKRARLLSKQTFDPEILINLQCDYCQKIITQREYTNVIGKKVIEAYQNKANEILLQQMKKQYQQQRKQQARLKSFQCALCMEQTLVSEGITMSCSNNHRFCKDCARGMIKQQIDDGNLGANGIVCNAQECNQPLSQQLIKNCIGQQDYEKYTNLQYKHLKVEGLVIRQCNGYIYKTGQHLVQIKGEITGKQYQALQDEMERKCNAIQSGNVPAAELKGQVVPCTAIVSFDPEQNKQGGILKCNVCGLDMCIKGCTSAHRGNTCQKYQQWQAANKKSAQLSFEQIRALNMAQCQNPKCRVPILRNGGCNWMKCKCGFQLCYICSRPWTLQDVHCQQLRSHPPFDVAKFLREH